MNPQSYAKRKKGTVSSLSWKGLRKTKGVAESRKNADDEEAEEDRSAGTFLFVYEKKLARS